MNDPYDMKVGLVTDGTSRGTKVIDPATDDWHERLPYFDELTYETERGMGWLTIKMKLAPARIEGVVTSATWHHFGGDGVTPVEGYVPHPSRNPIGKMMRIETDGLFANMRPMDDETRRLFSDSQFFKLTWRFVNRECQIHLDCLARCGPDSNVDTGD